MSPGPRPGRAFECPHPIPPPGGRCGIDPGEGGIVARLRRAERSKGVFSWDREAEGSSRGSARAHPLELT